MLRRIVTCGLLLAPIGCGSGGGPTAPSGGGGGGTPTPAPSTGVTVAGYVYYDENANGAEDGGEVVRLPGVTLSIGGRTGTSSTGGRFSIANVPTGAQQVSFAAGGLPPYFEAGRSVTVQVASSGTPDTAVPAILPVGTNRHNLYMGFGDSITAGEGSRSGGYLEYLADRLRSHWGKADLANQGLAGTRSESGAERLPASITKEHPAYTLILYGTNDWNDLSCKDERFPCYTIDALRSMVGLVRAVGSVPVLGTIPAVNPVFEDRQASERNAWVSRMNDLIRPMAAQEGAILADVQKAMLAQPNLADLFADHVHPNDSGHDVIAAEFFRAITTATGSSSASGGRVFSFSRGAKR